MAKKTSDIIATLEEKALRDMAEGLREGADLTAEQWRQIQQGEMVRVTQSVSTDVVKATGSIISAGARESLDIATASLEMLQDRVLEGYHAGVVERSKLAIWSDELRDIQRTFGDTITRQQIEISRTLALRTSEQYLSLVNRVVSEVQVNGLSLDNATRKMVKELARGEVSFFTDNAGRRWGAREWSERIVRTEARETITLLQEQRARDTGTNLVEVSAHVDARELCSPYQGKVYTISGVNPKYPSLATTSRGEPAGLFGINCRHTMFPYYEGISERAFGDIQASDEAYRDSQKQRALERKVRKTKREEQVYKQAGLTDLQDSAKIKRQDAEENLSAFLNITGRRRVPYREELFS